MYREQSTQLYDRIFHWRTYIWEFGVSVATTEPAIVHTAFCSEVKQLVIFILPQVLCVHFHKLSYEKRKYLNIFQSYCFFLATMLKSFPQSISYFMQHICIFLCCRIFFAFISFIIISYMRINIFACSKFA